MTKRIFFQFQHFDFELNKIGNFLCNLLIPSQLISGNFSIFDWNKNKLCTGRELAAAWDCPFIEASAKDRINVNDVFASVVREMNMTSEKRQQKRYCCCTLL